MALRPEPVAERPDPAYADPVLSDQQHAAADVLAIIKGMVDAAGARGETDEALLRVRVERAVFSYLEAAIEARVTEHPKDLGE